VRYGLSAGRVQSPALRIIMEREREIRAFIAEQYWKIEGLFEIAPQGLALGNQLTLFCVEEPRDKKEVDRILDTGKKPSVLSGIMKYKTTEYGRNVIMNSMDILAGVGICRGPNNPISEFYDALPISINVEGNNILTRNLIIFGNGLMKSHPNIYKLIIAVEGDSVVDFRKNLNHLMIILFQNYWKSIFSIDTYTRQQSQFVVLSHCMLLLGKRFKTAEFLSGRMADVLSNLYFYNALVWYEKHSAISKGIFKVAKNRLLNENNKLISEIVCNYPIPFLRNFISKWNNEKKILDKDLKYVVEKGIYEIDKITTGIGNNNNYLKLMKDNISILRHEPNHPKIKEIRDIIIQVDHFKKPETY
jgi:hypothetical protein